MNQTFLKTAQFYGRHAWKYPGRVVGVLLATPLTVLVNGYLPPLIVATVLSKLSKNSYTGADIWPEFGPLLIVYAALLLAGILTWRLVDFFAWRLEANVQRDTAQQVYDHLLRQSIDFHANNFSGSLVSQSNKLLAGYIRTADTTIFQTYPLLIGLVLTNIILIGKAPFYVLVLDIFAAIF